MSDPIQELKDLITAASISLSPPVAWLTFFVNLSTRRQDRSAEAREMLIQVKKQLDGMRSWAQTEYPPSADDRNWGNPLWSVNDFPSDRIHDFNLHAYSLPVDDRLRSALAALETAITRFRGLLREHRTFIDQTGGRFMVEPRAASVEWIERLKALNRAIHVNGIGTDRDPDGLHSTWGRAVEEVDRVLAGEIKVPESPYLWIGHILAIVLGLIGVGFLAGFIHKLLYSVSPPIRH